MLYIRRGAGDAANEEGALIWNRYNPCLTCGACCAFYRASFYWGECDNVTPGGVPVDMTEQLTDFRQVMTGTNQKEPRCVALLGIIGKKTRCSIHINRSSVCREFEPSWENGSPHERCDKARIHWGLKPLTPESWNRPGHPPEAA